MRTETLKNHGWPLLIAALIALAVSLDLKHRSLGDAPADTIVQEVNLASLERILADMKGKVVLLDFWATWCSPCRREIPGFIELQNEYASKGLVEVVGLSFDETGLEVVQNFARSAGVNYTMLWGYPDRDNIHRAFAFKGAYPTTIIIGRDGKRVSSLEGYHSPETFRQKVEELLSGMPPSDAPEQGERPGGEPAGRKLKIAVVGDKNDPRTTILAQAARDAKLPNAQVYVLDPANEADLKKIEELMVGVTPEPSAFVCDEESCAMPVTTPEELLETIRRMNQKGN